MNISQTKVKVDNQMCEVFMTKGHMKDFAFLKAMRMQFPNIIFNLSDIDYAYMRTLPDGTLKLDRDHTRGNYPVTVVMKYGDCSE